jgi:hypothetical protein
VPINKNASFFGLRDKNELCFYADLEETRKDIGICDRRYCTYSK